MVSKFENKTVEELKKICRKKNITGYSKLKKEDLIKLVKKNSKRKNVKVKKSKKGGANNNNLTRTDRDIKTAVQAWTNADTRDEAENIYGHISNWDTSQVTNMEQLFNGERSFNDDISRWNVSNVTNMYGMFQSANSFNGNINSWNTSNVINMKEMFYFAESFNGELSNWDTSKVTDMSFMFYYCQSFNQDISRWNTSNVTDMNRMFYYAKSFNQDISNWNTSNVTNMSHMFYDAQSFNQDISNWNTSNVVNINEMFKECPINNNYKPQFSVINNTNIQREMRERRERENYDHILMEQNHEDIRERENYDHILMEQNHEDIRERRNRVNNIILIKQNMLSSNNNTCNTKLYDHILNIDDNILENNKFEFEKQEGINAGGLSRTVFDLFYKTYFHKFFKYSDENNKDLGMIIKYISNNENIHKFYHATNKLIILAKKGDLQIFMPINEELLKLLKSDDPIQQINLNKKNIYDKDRLLNNKYRKSGYGDESKISDVIIPNKNNSKWNKNFKEINNNNNKKEVYFRRYLHSLGFKSDNHFVMMKQWINNYWLEHPTLFSNEMPSYLKKDFIKRIKLIEQGNEIEKNLTTNILTNKSSNSIINKYPNVKVLLEYILNDDNDEYRKKFCNWATGSIYFYGNIKIKLYQIQNQVPFISHTCFNRVDVFQTVNRPYINSIRTLNKQINSEQKSFSVA